MYKWNNKFRYQVASCWLFILSTAFLAVIDPKSIGAEGMDLKTSFQNNQILYFSNGNFKFHIFNMNLKSMTIMV